MARSSHHDAERAVHDAGLDNDDLIRRIDALARLLDGRFSVFGFRFGFDGLIGLIPGVGDAATAVLSFYLVFMAARAGASFSLIMHMIVNVLIDMIVGAVPVLGDLFDFAFRANAINAKLLHRHLEAKRAAR
ncbi:MAG: DUF4112 domain-containing protein [Pseudomonadota bacterium]